MTYKNCTGFVFQSRTWCPLHVRLESSVVFPQSTDDLFQILSKVGIRLSSDRHGDLTLVRINYAFVAVSFLTSTIMLKTAASLNMTVTFGEG